MAAGPDTEPGDGNVEEAAALIEGQAIRECLARKSREDGLLEVLRDCKCRYLLLMLRERSIITTSSISPPSPAAPTAVVISPLLTPISARVRARALRSTS